MGDGSDIFGSTEFRIIPNTPSDSECGLENAIDPTAPPPSYDEVVSKPPYINPLEELNTRSKKNTFLSILKFKLIGLI